MIEERESKVRYVRATIRKRERRNGESKMVIDERVGREMKKLGGR